MRGTLAKQLRRQAKHKAIEWYRSLLEDTSDVSDYEIFSYVVDCDHVTVEGQTTVSEHTKRRFYLNEKKLWKYNYQQ